MTTLTYAIGDIHGRLDLLTELLGLIEADAVAHRADAKVVFTGDYVDRGPASFGVVERIMAGPSRPQDRFVCLRGNHDHLFAQAVTTGDDVPDWAWMLFWYTIQSYGATPETVATNSGLRRHAAYLAALPLTHDDGTNLFVHAGIRPGVKLEDQLDHDLIWIREEFLTHALPLPRRVVHGHTIMGIAPVISPYRVSIDTGAYRTGVLTAAVIDDVAVRVLQAIGQPDRGAIVREAILAARMAGRSITPSTQRAFDEYLAGRIDAEEMSERASLASAA